MVLEYTGASGAGYVIAIALDADYGSMYVYKYGTALNSGAASHTGLVMPQIPVVSLNGSSRSGNINFGQRPFKYTPPTGYVSLCTQNLPDPPIADPSTAFDVITATGTGADRTFTMPGDFGPDLVWAKQRNGTSNHAWFDTVRGATKRLVSNSTQVEDTQATQLKAFTSTGFTYGSDIPNNSSQTGVYWCWDGGTSTVSNTDGSQTSQVRVNQTAGFSIATFNTPSPSANFTYGHGLNAVPEFVIHKFTGWNSNFTYHNP